MHGPAIRIVPLADDTELLAATRSLLAAPVDVVVATTGIGFRGWIEAAEGWGLGARLLRSAGHGRRCSPAARRRRARSGPPGWSRPGRRTSECERRAAGVPAAVRCGRPADRGAAARRTVAGLRGRAARGRRRGRRGPGVPVDAARRPGAAGPPAGRGAGRPGRRADVHQRARRGERAADGAESAADAELVLEALRQRGAGGLCRRDHRRAAGGARDPGRAARAGADRRRWSGSWRSNCPRGRPGCGSPARDWRLRGQAVRGRRRAAPGAARADGRAADAGRRPRPGGVAAGAAGGLAQSGGEEHAVETAIGRLRTALGEPRMVHTVVKRGYRLAMEPCDDAGAGRARHP